jgi:hypothetical protein
MSTENIFGLLPDGYDFSGYLAGVPRLYPPVRFKYRPMLRAERAALARASEGLTGEEQVKRMAADLEKRIKSWDFPRPPKAETFLRLAPAFFDRLFAAVVGDIPPDPDPQEKAEKFDEEKEAKN